MNTASRSAALAVLLSLSACHPIYKTTYEFFPPADMRGRECINQCQVPLELCEANARQTYEACLTRAEYAYQRCEARKRYSDSDKNKCVENCYCGRDYCRDPQVDTCQERYRTCYTNCGGKIKSETVCTANCDKR